MLSIHLCKNEFHLLSKCVLQKLVLNVIVFNFINENLEIGFLSFYFILYFKRLYLYLKRGEERQKKRGRNIHMREKHRQAASGMCLERPHWGPNSQSRHVT